MEKISVPRAARDRLPAPQKTLDLIRSASSGTQS